MQANTRKGITLNGIPLVLSYEHLRADAPRYTLENFTGALQRLEHDFNSLDFTIVEDGLAVKEAEKDDTTTSPAICEHANGRKELAIYLMSMGRVSSVLKRIEDTFPGLPPSQIGLQLVGMNLRAFKI